jgi:hypothetical protein
MVEGFAKDGCSSCSLVRATVDDDADRDARKIKHTQQSDATVLRHNGFPRRRIWENAPLVSLKLMLIVSRKTLAPLLPRVQIRGQSVATPPPQIPLLSLPEIDPAL